MWGRARAVLLACLGAILAAAGLLLALAFHNRYWRWRDCFNELGRCFDPVTQDVYLQQSGLVYGGLVAACMGAGALLVGSAWRTWMR
jgi:hypothetical protein